MPPEKVDFLIGALIGGLIAGCLCGLIPLALAQWKGRLPVGIAAWLSCLICGGILGLLLAGPVALIFSTVILALGRPPSEGLPDEEGYEEEHAYRVGGYEPPKR